MLQWYYITNEHHYEKDQFNIISRICWHVILFS